MFLPAGEAWQAAWRLDPRVQLYGPDGFHPSKLGTTLAALVIYARLTNTPPARVALPYPAKTAQLLRAAAAEAIEDPAGWRDEPPLPLARGEVAAAVFRGGIAVVGGFIADGSSARRVDLYAPTTQRWRRLPDLPVAVNHTFAAGWRGKLYVAGGYGSAGRLHATWVLDAGSWRPLPSLPYGLAAGGAAVVGGKLYLVGGVAGPPDRSVLVRRALVLDLTHPRRWRFAPGPSGREHLAVTTSAGTIYAIGGRSAGYDTNSRLVESWRPGQATWRTRTPLPEARGGTGAAAVGGTIVSLGGEAPQGTIGSVFAYDASGNTGTACPTCRHRGTASPSPPSADASSQSAAAARRDWPSATSRSRSRSATSAGCAEGSAAVRGPRSTVVVAVPDLPRRVLAAQER